jgi:diketogulonate reductase-like aldo/keto reductase
MHSEIPRFIYGTAWKEEATERLTGLALQNGFRAIDTANQRKHYHEAGVGAAIKRATTSGLVTREQLFIQTKFTHPAGQDHRLPYDLDASPAQQLKQSFESSLEHLGLDYLDSYLLHGPSYRQGWAPADLEIWGAIEQLHSAGRTRHIGVSNVSKDQLALLCHQAQIKPQFVQNRCYARTGWDAEVRQVCLQHGIHYQGFSLLTANSRELSSPKIRAIAERTGRTLAQIAFSFALQVGMIPLTGTSDPEHMLEDLESLDIVLTSEDLLTLQA